MNARIVTLGNEKHVAVELLLPWYINGSLGADETAELETHLRECPACQAEAAWQRRLQSTAEPAVGSGDVDTGWAALRRQLDSQAEATAVASGPAVGDRVRREPRTEPRRTGPRWLPWAFAAQFACVVGLVVFLFAPAATRAPYRALGAPGAASNANVLVVFRPDATEAEIRRALRAGDARLVGGPTSTDAYLLDVPPAHIDETLTHMRGDPAIARVESLETRHTP